MPNMSAKVFSHPDRELKRFRPFKAMAHFRNLMADKEDTEQVFHIFECLPRKGFVPDAKAFIDSPRGQRLMEREPFLPAILDDHETLLKLPAGTVGRAYVDFMRREGLSAAGLVAESEKMLNGKPRLDDQLQWYGERLRDTHDLFHILTGYGRDALGEQCVLGFTYGQTRNLGNFFIAYVGGFELKRKVKTNAPVFAAIREGQRNGTVSAKIIDEDIISLLAEPLAAARARLGIGTPVQYHRAHQAYQSVGIDPYNFLPAAV
jgi:ubiquinone biosynthesis protein COQ4